MVSKKRSPLSLAIKLQIKVGKVKNYNGELYIHIELIHKKYGHPLKK